MDPTAIVVLSPDGAIRYWSPGAEILFGYRAPDVTGSSMDVIIPEHLRERHWCGWRKAWENGDIRDGLVAMIPVRCADGEIRQFAGRLQPVRAPHGDLVAAMGIWSPASSGDARLPVLS
jgi:PAS domain S-box-containing protein